MRWSERARTLLMQWEQYHASLAMQRNSIGTLSNASFVIFVEPATSSSFSASQHLSSSATVTPTGQEIELSATPPQAMPSPSEAVPSAGRARNNKRWHSLQRKQSTWLQHTPPRKQSGFADLWPNSTYNSKRQLSSTTTTKGPLQSPKTPSTMIAQSTSTCSTTSFVNKSKQTLSLFGTSQHNKCQQIFS